LNYRFVINQLGLLLLVLSAAIFALSAWDFFASTEGFEGELSAIAYEFGAAVIGAVVGGVLWYFGRSGDTERMGRREALLLVALSWLVGAALAALPYWFWAMGSFDEAGAHPFQNFVDCYFEAMSGLTTTGATVLSQVDQLPRGLLLWRALTHWLGGLGIVVLFVAVLPTLGVGGKKLFQVEAPGPTQQGVRPRIRETARVLWFIYCGMTLVQIVALKLCGMSGFDAVCHTFATLATGGFGTRNASIGHYDSVAIDAVVIVFMVLAGANFGLYYHCLKRNFRVVWADPELRCYLGIIAVATIIVAGSIMHTNVPLTTGETVEVGAGGAVRHGLFQVVSIQTTTGFATADFNRWSFVPKAVLVLLMFVGASAGSTGGGIKVIRILIAFKVMIAQIEQIFRPNVVRKTRIGRMSVDDDLRLGTIVYVLGIFVLWVAGTVALMLFEQHRPLDITSAATASAATLNNIGPGLGLVGAVENYGWFGTPSKVVMSLLMVLGRLEVYAVLVLFLPRFWRSE